MLLDFEHNFRAIFKTGAGFWNRHFQDTFLRI